MAKIKSTRNELKRQTENLKRYQRYLPTLALKKLYLQIELERASRALAEKLDQEKARLEAMTAWVAVLGQDAGIAELVQMDAVETDRDNIAGVDVPIFRRVRFKEIPYDLYTTPLWIDRAVTELRRILALRGEILVLQDLAGRIREELYVATQRVNLFEKVLIPQTQGNIRKIQVSLSDQQTAAVVRGKIAKAKLLEAPGEASG